MSNLVRVLLSKGVCWMKMGRECAVRTDLCGGSIGQDTREADWSGPRAVEVGRMNAFKIDFGAEFRGLADGSD